MTIYKTPRYEEDFIERVAYSRRRWDAKVARETHRQLKEAETRIETEPDFGTLDPEHHSDRFHFARIENRAKIIFERYGDDAVIVMAGGDTMDWKSILKELEPYIERQIESGRRAIEQHRAAQQSQPASTNPAVATGGDISDGDTGQTDPEARRQAEYRARAEAAEAKHDKAMDDKTQAPPPQPGQGQDIND